MLKNTIFRLYGSVIGTQPYVPEEYIASIFNAEELAKQETSGNRWHSFFAYSSALKMEATYSLDMLASLLVIWQNPEDRNLHNARSNKKVVAYQL
jgi:hypothetical protein